jgi:hypothetical protein
MTGGKKDQRKNEENKYKNYRFTVHQDQLKVT